MDFAYDIGIFAGIGVSMYAMNHMLGLRHAQEARLFDEYPAVQRSGFTHIMAQLHALEQPTAHSELLRLLERLLTLTQQQTNLEHHGFEVNRLAATVPKMAREICRTAVHSKKADVAALAMDMEGDHMEALEGMCDQVVRDMILGAARG